MARLAASGLAIGLLILAGGCRRQSTLVEAGPALHVRNHLGTQVRVVGRPCGTSDQPQLLHDGAIAEGGTREIPMRRGCFDFDAIDEAGEIVGRQHGVELRRPMEWDIRR